MIAIEGTVGVGKSQLYELLIKSGYTPHIHETHSDFLLDTFYQNKSDVSFLLQVHFLTKRLVQIDKLKDIKHSVLERSIYGEYVFAKMLLLNNEMTEEEYSVFIGLLDAVKSLLPKPDLIVYLTASKDVILKSIKNDGKYYEQSVDEAYWEALDEAYKEYFDNFNECKVLKLNVDNLDLKYNIHDQQFIVNKINELIEEALNDKEKDPTEA